MPAVKDVTFGESNCLSLFFRSTNFEMQSRNWKLQDIGRVDEAMFGAAFYINDKFQSRINSRGKAKAWSEVHYHNFILKDLKLCFDRNCKGKVVNIF